MRLDELADREDFWRIFGDTFSKMWAGILERPVRVSLGVRGGGQLWRVQPLLTAVFSGTPSRRARRFLRDSFCFTSVKHRMLPQLAAGAALTTPLGIRGSSRGAFRVVPAIPGPEHLLILPGNRRIRLFDFGRGMSRVHIKSGFDRGAIGAEVTVRGGGAEGPFVPITRHGADFAWFEEAIFEGYSLARCPPWFAAHRLARKAVAALDDWAEAGDTVSAKDAATDLVDSIGSMVDSMPHLAGLQIVHTSERLAERVSPSIHVERTASHGDLQPGNVLVGREGTRVVLTDWEFHGLRIAHYDRLVLALGARSPRGLGSRLGRFVRNEATSSLLTELPRNSSWRITRSALFGLEDIEWRLSNCQNVPYETVPSGLCTLVQELAELHPQF